MCVIQGSESNLAMWNKFSRKPDQRNDNTLRVRSTRALLELKSLTLKEFRSLSRLDAIGNTVRIIDGNNTTIIDGNTVITIIGGKNT